ncbi:MAG TPA: FAD-dependent oxidoreductase, partial [Kineosporiaceae bacterium]
MPDRVLIVGASLAGVRTAEALRRCGHAGEVLLVGAEPGSDEGVAADRPPLSKAFLADPRTPAPPLTSRARLAELDVRLVTGRAVDVDLGCGSVAVHGGKGLPFDVLVVATGSTPRTVPGLEPRPGVHALRTAADAAAIRAAAAQA